MACMEWQPQIKKGDKALMKTQESEMKREMETIKKDCMYIKN